ncbi:formyltetrahydrofolate-dependent phosphoribosylglycinamide formyltransferase [Tranquillimonas rosea]|uniref:Phosphoribosylglycinamide formyltransferase n=1 Tax=Tranquillimonas rosea TaxID=641238 RepID=A0A1H9TE58_9RHOB|nr:phosphoribosylglycinamide formyltransferase [Tranquillimonas rosea]SER95327.1 formyltetrahydrofolate-dependent phosphoribosylglycinamide formyltransferase [Tranquillimonas rosea]
MRVALLISGSGSNMVALARSMTGAHPARPVLVVSNRPGAGGLDKAAAMGIGTACVDHRAYDGRAPFEEALDAELRRASPDLICLAGFMRILTPDFVSRWEGKMLNIHPSLLPAYPGLDTHGRAIAAGDRVAGCSVHRVTAELDAGPVLGQAVVPVVAGDTSDTLAARVLRAEHRLYPEVLRRVAGDGPLPVTLR